MNTAARMIEQALLWDDINTTLEYPDEDLRAFERILRAEAVGPGKPGRPPRGLGGSSRPNGRHARFQGTSHHADRKQAALPSGHPALLENRTMFPKGVHRADKVPRVLISGINSAKIGKRIVKGAWRGMPVFTLTLEERATCPQMTEQTAACVTCGLCWSPAAAHHRIVFIGHGMGNRKPKPTVRRRANP